jgi:hypothetical protein
MFGNDYSKRVRRWLEKVGFTNDPFAVHEADQERAALPFLFIDRPYVHQVVGDPMRPQSAFLLARRGEGKSATREIVAYTCTQGRIRQRVLPVRYCDFSLVLEQSGHDPNRVTARLHVNAIIRATLQALADHVPPALFSHLSSSQRSLLMGFAAIFASPITRISLEEIVSDAPRQLEWSMLSPSETLEALVRIVCALGMSQDHHFQAVYFLVDRVDETSAGAENAIQLLGPLISEGGLMVMPSAAFKFFLATEVGETLLSYLRRDRLIVETIAWNDQALRDMLGQRLLYFSNNRIDQFGQLCTAAARGRPLTAFIARSQYSPRTLLRLCEVLVRCHVERTSDALIDASDITAALVEFERIREIEQLSAMRGNQPAESRSAGPRPESHILIDPSQRSAYPRQFPALSEIPARGLHLNDSGHVWLDGKPLTPPLTNLEFRLLHALYRVAPEILSQEELVSIVWDSPTFDEEKGLRTADDQNLRKVVERLRRRLASFTQADGRKFIGTARGRGYWLRKV